MAAASNMLNTCQSSWGEFRLPVFQGVTAQLDCVWTSYGLVMRALFGHVGESAKNPVAGKRDEKERARHPGEAVAPDKFDRCFGRMLFV